jgi:hypothetical protein
MGRRVAFFHFFFTPAERNGRENRGFIPFPNAREMNRERHT